ncbi:MAG: ferric reductase-like transmembrane domain-containing protein [Pseudomonadota bacterium]
MRAALIWTVLAAAIVVPTALAAMSPYLAYREAMYIASGFAGIVALGLMLAQPLLAGGNLPGLPMPVGRRVHRWVGGALIIGVVVHVGGLWITSPPDVIDALLFVSPTPFSLWGVIAMWTLFAAAALAALRKPLRIPPRIWRIAHTALAVVTVAGGVAHAMLVEGTMEWWSKAALCALTVIAMLKVVYDLRAWAGLRARSVRPR